MENNEPDKKRLYSVLAAAFLGWMFDGLEMGIFPLIARPALQQMQAAGGVTVSDAFIGQWMGYATAAFLVGAALGGVAFGWLGDKIGRVRAMSLSIMCYSLFTGLIYFATEPWHLAGARFIAALGMGGEWSLGVALVMEIWPANRRPILAGLIGAAANVGFLLIAGLALALSKPDLMNWLGAHLTGLFPARWFTKEGNWRLLLLLGAMPAFLTFFIRIFVPESEKWKHATATAPKARVRDIFAPGIARQTILGACLAGVALLGTWGSVQQATPWAAKMAQTQNINRAEATAKTQITAGIGAIIGTILAALLADKFNRRRIYFVLSLLSLVVCQYLFRTVDTFNARFLVLITLANGVTAAFYGWLPLYLPELFPTRVRATGSGFTFNSGRVLAAVGSVIVASMYGGNEDYPKMCAVTSLIYVPGLLLIWLCPETKGRPLPA